MTVLWQLVTQRVAQLNSDFSRLCARKLSTKWQARKIIFLFWQTRNCVRWSWQTLRRPQSVACAHMNVHTYTSPLYMHYSRGTSFKGGKASRTPLSGWRGAQQTGDGWRYASVRLRPRFARLQRLRKTQDARARSLCKHVFQVSSHTRTSACSRFMCVYVCEWLWMFNVVKITRTRARYFYGVKSFPFIICLRHGLAFTSPGFAHAYTNSHSELALGLLQRRSASKRRKRVCCMREQANRTWPYACRLSCRPGRGSAEWWAYAR